MKPTKPTAGAAETAVAPAAAEATTGDGADRTGRAPPDMAVRRAAAALDDAIGVARAAGYHINPRQRLDQLASLQISATAHAEPSPANSAEA